MSRRITHSALAVTAAAALGLATALFGLVAGSLAGWVIVTRVMRLDFTLDLSGALVAAGIGRVVVASDDPSTKAAGRGLGQEEAHVDVGHVDEVEHLAAGTQHLAGLGAEDQPEQLVLTAEHVGHRRPADAPARADPGPVGDAFGEGLEDAREAVDPLVGNVWSGGHGARVSSGSC